MCTVELVSYSLKCVPTPKKVIVFMIPFDRAYRGNMLTFLRFDPKVDFFDTKYHKGGLGRFRFFIISEHFVISCQT